MRNNLRRFYAYRLFATSTLFAPVAVLVETARGLSLAQVLTLNGVYCVTAIVSDVPTGAFADRAGRKKSLLLGAVVLAGACLVDAVARSFAAFATGTILEALSLTLVSGADSAYLHDLLERTGRAAEYAACEGRATALHFVGNTVAYAVGGLLAARSLALPYLVTLGVALISLVTAARLEEPAPARRPRGGVVSGLAAHARRGVELSLDHAPLRRALGYSALVFVMVRASDYFFPLVLRAPRVGLGPAAIGGVLAILQLVAALCARTLPALRDRLGERTLVIGAPVLLSAGYALLGHTASLAALATLCGQSAAGGLFSPLAKTLVNRAVSDSCCRATVLSLESVGRRLAYGLFSTTVLRGALAGAGLSSALAAMSILGGAGTLLLVLTSPAPWRTTKEAAATTEAR